MRVIGLTGGVGMGKSTVSGFLEQWGEKVIDTDSVAREMVMPGQAALEEIKAHFGEEIILPGGTLNRRRLGEIVFAEEGKRRELEAILHPRIRQAWQARLQSWAAAGERRAVVVIPLLFETGAEEFFETIICVACSLSVQKNRLRERGWSDAEIGRRIEAQMEIGSKMDRADYVIWNESTREVCELQSKRLIKAISGKTASEPRKNS